MWYVRLTDGTNRELQENTRGVRLVSEGKGTRYDKYDDAYWCGESWHQQGPDHAKKHFWEIITAPDEENLAFSHLGLPGVGLTFCGLDYTDTRVKSYDLVSLDIGPGWCPHCMDQLEMDDLNHTYSYSDGDCQSEE